MNSFSYFISFLYIILLLICKTIVIAIVIPTSPYNITEILSAYPKYSRFSALLSTNYVDYDMSFLTESFTVLVVPNYNLRTTYSFFSSSHPSNNVLRHHVLLKYLTLSDLRAYPASGTLVPTLFKSLGHRHDDIFTSVNITHNPTTGSVTIHSTTTTTVLSQVSTAGKISVLSVEALIVPDGFQSLMSFNITKILLQKKEYNIMSSLLAASGAAEEVNNEEGEGGITLFAPPDLAFVDPQTQPFKSLPYYKKAMVLKYHVVNGYYPRGLLQQVVDPFHQTLATKDLGGARFTLNISRVNGSVVIDTGVVTASVTRTLYDRNPLAVFAVSKVLLPIEIFG